eukprot:9226190-Ditylum_brightwellii.AAC.1
MCTFYNHHRGGLFHFTRGQKQKVYHIFNRCEDAQEQGHYDNAGIEGQIIADVLKKGGNFCGTAEVLNRWKVSQGLQHIAVSTIKYHVDKFMSVKK